MRQNLAYLSFNRGLCSRLGLARSDVKRIGLSAETYLNWMPRTLGSMSIRPGLKYLGATASNAATRMLPFVFANTDKALIELTPSALRVWIDDALITRPSVSSTITNGTFATDLTGWTDADESGATSAWVTGGYLGLTGTGSLSAIRYQAVTVAGANVGVEHGLTIVIQRGPVILKIGSSVGGDDFLSQTTLQTGTHSLSIIPSTSFYIQFESSLVRQTLVNSVAIEAAGVMSVATSWVSADLPNVRADQSGNIIFVACEGQQQRRIQRRGTRSWSVELYLANDGPFQTENLGPITVTPSALTGNITVTASASLFVNTLVGSLFKITSDGQLVEKDVTAENQFSDAIKVTGVDSTRIFQITRTGTWSATVTLQRSYTSSTGPWEDVTTYTTNATISYDDTFDNQIIWYRIGVKTGGFSSGTVELTLDYAIGSISGAVRFTGYTSPTLMSAEVVTTLGDIVATDNWSEGSWSDRRGWPSAVALYEGRLGWAGKDRVDLSVSDAYNSFDAETVGDSGPIARGIGSGPVDVINWILAMQRLVLGGQGTEFSVKTSTFDDPITPSNFSIKPASTQGSASVQAVLLDKNGIFVQRGGIRVFELSLQPESGDYGSTNLTNIVPEIGSPGIVRIAIQRQPDTRLHCIRSDGTAAVLVFDKVENVLCWVEVNSDGASGLIEDVVVLPGSAGDTEDLVYYVVKRTVNGAAVRYLEKWAFQKDCVGGSLSFLADSFVQYTRTATTSVTGLSHLEGESVVVWADGKDVGTIDTSSTWTQTYTVSGGAITLAAAAANVVIGLPYTAQWQSGKLVQIPMQLGTALTMIKVISELGLILADVHPKGLRYGPDFTNLDDLPQVEDGTPIDSDTMRTAYDGEMTAFPGEWDTDSRLCLQAVAPRPCTVLAAVAGVEASE